MLTAEEKHQKMTWMSSTLLWLVCHSVLLCAVEKCTGNTLSKMSGHTHDEDWANLLFPDQRMTWTEGNTFCQKNDGHLLVVNSEEEEETLRNQMNSQLNKTAFWVGLKYHKNMGQWKWTNELPLDRRISPWDKWEPDTEDSGEGCVEYVRGGVGMNDMHCREARCFLCSKDPDALKTMPVPFSYKVLEFHNKRVTWKQAYETCREKDWSLVRVPTWLEKGVLNYYILYDESDCESWWLDRDNRTQHEQVQWIETTSHDSVSLSSWRPKIRREEEHCAVIRNGLLSDHPCDQKFPVICDKKSNQGFEIKVRVVLHLLYSCCVVPHTIIMVLLLVMVSLGILRFYRHGIRLSGLQLLKTLEIENCTILEHYVPEDSSLCDPPTVTGAHDEQTEPNDKWTCSPYLSTEKYGKVWSPPMMRDESGEKGSCDQIKLIEEPEAPCRYDASDKSPEREVLFARSVSVTMQIDPIVTDYPRSASMVKKADKMLFDACKENNLEKVKEALETRGIQELMEVHQNQRTALHVAVECKAEPVVKYLLDKNWHVEGRDSKGMTPLHLAAMGGHVAMCELLIEAGSDVMSKDLSGNEALHLAATRGNVSIAEALIREGASINSRGGRYGDTPLHIAALRHHENLVQFLLDNGADKEAANAEGRTPVDVAGHQRIVSLLRNYRSEARARTRGVNHTCIYKLIK